MAACSSSRKKAPSLSQTKKDNATAAPALAAEVDSMVVEDGNFAFSLSPLDYANLRSAFDPVEDDKQMPMISKLSVWEGPVSIPEDNLEKATPGQLAFKPGRLTFSGKSRKTMSLRNGSDVVPAEDAGERDAAAAAAAATEEARPSPPKTLTLDQEEAIVATGEEPETGKPSVPCKPCDLHDLGCAVA